MAAAQHGWGRQRLNEFVLAFSLLTRLPCPPVDLGAPVGVGDYVWAFPFAGAVVGAIGAFALSAASSLGAPADLAALAAIVATLAVTGALHEDGLADFCDGVGGGRTRERKLEIMRDSSIGSYGAAALFVVLAARWGALSHFVEPRAAGAALILAHTLSRGLLALVLEYWQPARKDGLAAAAGGSWLRSAAAIGLSGTIALTFAAPAVALCALLTATVAVVATAAIATRYLGGYTGDVLGASQQFAEALVLVTVLIVGAH